MSSKTKIIVLRSKELVYALVLAVISVLIIMTAVSLFAPQSENPQKRENTAESSVAETETESIAPQSLDDIAPTRFIPGIYSSEIRLGSTNAELQITVDAQRITSITLANLDESISTLYPLMQPTLNEIASKIIESQSLENISCKGENRYTSMLLLQTIRSTLDKAIEPESEDSAATAIY